MRCVWYVCVCTCVRVCMVCVYVCMVYVCVCLEGCPQPHICTVYDRVLGDFPAKAIVCTPIIYNLYMVLANLSVPACNASVPACMCLMRHLSSPLAWRACEHCVSEYEAYCQHACAEC